MMIRFRTVTATIVCALSAAVPFALATESSPKTLQQCAALLPPGKIYNFQMTGTIDRTTAVPELHGQLQVDDGTQVDRTKERSSEEFAKCVSSFIK